MDGPRRIKEDEYLNLIQFLNTELRPDTEWSIQDEYPTTFNRKNSRNLFIIEENEAPLSHAALRYLLVKTPQAVLKVASIGSVVTDKSHRRKGLSQQIINTCLEQARSEDADLAILWTDLFDFYRKLGFELGGSEVAFLIDDFVPVEQNNLIFREGSNLSPEAFLKVFSKHTVSSVRTIEDVRNYLKIPNSRVFTAWNQNGQLEAYAVEGKGADLAGYIHEWGGGVSKLLPLINYARKQIGQPLTLISPSHSTGLIQKLESIGLKSHTGSLGMIRILDIESVIEKVHRYARTLGHENLFLQTENETVLVGVGDTYTTLQPDQFSQFFFGPIPNTFWANFASEKQTILKSIFPLSLWVWGWDSI